MTMTTKKSTTTPAPAATTALSGIQCNIYIVLITKVCIIVLAPSE